MNDDLKKIFKKKLNKKMRMKEQVLIV